MSLSAILDVAIALVFIYFLLALIASGVQEVIAGVFAWRGTYLSKGIDVILDNEASAKFAWVDFKDFLTAHFTSQPGQTASERLKQKIDDEQRGVATPEQEVLHRVLDVHTHPLMRSAPSDLPSYIPARNFSLALLETLRDGSKVPLFSQAERTVAALPEGDLKKTLSVFVQDAGGDVDKLRAHLERWFDDAMDRVSGIYTRLSQYVMVILGVLLAISLNVDSLRIAQTLWDEPTLRAALVANAGAAVLPTPAPTDQGTAAAATPGTPRSQAALTTIQEFEAQHIPFGWNFGPAPPLPNFSISTIPGWIITAGAVALGAPFWFSLLQNLGNVRNAGPKPKRSDDVSAQDS